MVHIGRRARVLSVLALAGGALCASVLPAIAAQTSAAVEVVQISGVIDPPVYDYVTSRLAAAPGDDVAAVILEIDSPGGLQISNRRLVDAVLESPVPVIAWVAPRGARAASTGALLVYASHLAFMAESTELGPAGPPTLASDTAAERAANGALLERLAQMRGRGPGSAPPPVLGDPPVTVDAAVALHYVDGAASSLRELLETVDAERVVTDDGTVTIETWDEDAGTPSVAIRFGQMNLLQRVLHAVTSPELALALFLIGLFGLIFELYNPGIGLAAIVGFVALLLAVYALSVLPTNWGGVLVVSAGIMLLLLDLHAAALGAMSLAGIVALVVGAGIMFRGAPDALSLSWWTIAAAALATLIFFISVMTAALRVRLRRPVDDEAGIVGTVGEAKTDIAPEGTVLTKGTLWRARTMETGIAAGSKVEVKATEGMVLLVEPLHESEPIAGDD